jgi:hypothetical protein
MSRDHAIDFGRRAFLYVAGLATLSPWLAQSLPASAQGTSSGPMKIGVVGSGKLGGAVGGRWVKAGHEVMFSSRHPEELKSMIEALGPRARIGTVAEAIAFGDVVLMAVPYAALPQIGRDSAQALSGKIVIDACNPILARDGEAAKEALQNGIGPTTMKYLPGARVVRAFNPVNYRNFEGETAEGGERVGMPVAGDDPEAVKVAVRLVKEAGADPVVVPLARAMEWAPGTPLFPKVMPADEWRKQLGVTG